MLDLAGEHEEISSIAVALLHLHGQLDGKDTARSLYRKCG